MRVAFFALLFAATFPHIAPAQEGAPAKVPAVQEAPRVNPEAVAALDAMMARYGALHSYSDKCEVHLDGAQSWSQQERDRTTFTGTLAFARPDKLRFEGKSPGGAFLLVNDGTTTHILNPEHGGVCVERPQGSPLNLRDDYSHSNLKLRAGDAMPIDGGWSDVGPTLVAEALIFRPQIWLQERDLVVDTSFAADETVNGEACRVVQMAIDYGTGFPIKSRLWIARSDGLLRRFERSFSNRKGTVVMTETHSEVRSDPDLAPATWSFAAPPTPERPTAFPIHIRSRPI